MWRWYATDGRAFPLQRFSSVCTCRCGAERHGSSDSCLLVWASVTALIAKSYQLVRSIPGKMCGMLSCRFHDCRSLASVAPPPHVHYIKMVWCRIGPVIKLSVTWKWLIKKKLIVATQCQGTRRGFTQWMDYGTVLEIVDVLSLFFNKCLTVGNCSFVILVILNRWLGWL